MKINTLTFWLLLVLVLPASSLADSRQVSSIHFVSGEAPATTPLAKYFFKLKVSGGRPPYKFSISSGRLPRGVKLANNGNLRGKAEVDNADIAFVVRVQDSRNARIFQKNRFYVSTQSLKIPHEVTQENILLNEKCLTKISYKYSGIFFPRIVFYAFAKHASSPSGQALLSLKPSTDLQDYAYGLPLVFSPTNERTFYATVCDAALQAHITCTSFFGSCS